jgi:hypothetical protein
MGGNVFKEYQTGRLSADAYFKLTNDFASRFHLCFGFYPVLIKAYHNKESFGDADFIIDSSKLPSNWTDHLKKTFFLSDKQYSKNSNIVSIGYENFQFDLIVTPADEIDSAIFYFALNDFGNLIGRIGHKLGIKIGHRGISIVVRHKDASDHILDEIFLTKNAKESLDILGLDAARYDIGFDSLEDIFEYIASSKYFDPDIYALEHRSGTSRVRDKKRETYSKFLKWVADTSPKTNHNFSNKSELGGYSLRMPYYETDVLTRYPEVSLKVKTLIEHYEFNKEFKKVYNGEIVSELTGLSGKELGAFMQMIKPTEHQKIEFVKNPYLPIAYIKFKNISLNG